MRYLKNKQLFALGFVCITFLFSCQEDEGNNPDPTTSQQQNNPALPSSISGQVVNMTFTAAQAGAPYTLNQKTTFTFSSSGMLFIDDDPAANDGDEVTISGYSNINNELIWTDSNADLNYALSFKSDSSINEVNLFRISTSSFLGSFVPDQGINTALVSKYEGTYTVATVKNGTHNRMTVVIDANGNIDFDNNTQLSTSNYARIEDKLNCCDAITIDFNPYPTEPYARVILYQDSTDILNEIDYYPRNNSFVGRVNVTF